MVIVPLLVIELVILPILLILLSYQKKVMKILKNLKIWVVDCLRDKPHISHANVEQTLKMIKKAKPEQSILTHMTHELDYDDLNARTPAKCHTGL